MDIKKIAQYIVLVAVILASGVFSTFQFVEAARAGGGDGGQVLATTAFGETLVAELSPIIQGIFEYTVDNTQLTENSTTSSATITQADGMALIGSGTTANSVAMLNTHRHAKYRSGQGGMSRFTTLFTSPVATTHQLIGLADATNTPSSIFVNGYTVGYVGTTFGFHKFQNGATTTIAQADFNDPLDGTGDSGMKIDLTKLNVWQIQFQYLGGGAITLSVEDDKTGAFTEVHKLLYANKNIVPSVYNPNFHHTIYVDNGGTTSDIVLKSASYAYFVEGRQILTELQQPQQSSGIKQKTSVTTEVAILTIRNKESYASKDNFIDVLIENISASIEASSANNLGKIRVIKNATLGGSPSWSDINTTDSIVEIDTSGTTVTGGVDVFPAPLAGKNDRILENLIPFAIILGEGETLTITGTSANSATMEASVLWRELF